MAWALGHIIETRKAPLCQVSVTEILGYMCRLGKTGYSGCNIPVANIVAHLYELVIPPGCFSVYFFTVLHRLAPYVVLLPLVLFISCCSCGACIVKICREMEGI